eukprot:TRINITY_DN12868_c0_g1::TRINITY_DN12868_c0_g1_i1::g.8145::m.8145 TRINITY_DN12868_c0_g1::TRINITY_DN12868_c0_g1_i1::g.8145  ORF type:complete len:137 (+),score=-9.97,JTB/PF05439.7/1.4e-09 TRINITY_DN12868_c0_g1_i1:68-478(+)
MRSRTLFVLLTIVACFPFIFCNTSHSDDPGSEVSHLHCNITGPCEPCSSTDKTLPECARTSYRQRISCFVNDETESSLSYEACLPSSGSLAKDPLSLLIFECVMAIVLVASIWIMRKRKADLNIQHYQKIERQAFS